MPFDAARFPEYWGEWGPEWDWNKLYAISNPWLDLWAWSVRKIIEMQASAIQNAVQFSHAISDATMKLQEPLVWEKILSNSMQWFWELQMVYGEMIKAHANPLSHLTTQGNYQTFMTSQKARKALFETSLAQLQLLKNENWYILPEQQQLENFIRINLAFTFTFERPDYNVEWAIESCEFVSPRMNLLKFLPENCDLNGKTMLLIAPISGHFPTLLRKTIQSLTDIWYTVFVTDWQSALQMPSDTPTSLDDYTESILEAYSQIQTFHSQEFHALAVCQPGPITLSATALSNRYKIPWPQTLTLMASPIDTSINPTEVWKAGEKISSQMLELMQLHSPKSGKRVYPGVMQIMNFISANFEDHRSKFMEIAMQNAPLSIEQEKILAFYHEYFAVMDMPHDYFTQTIQRVFQKREWKTGIVKHRDEAVDLSGLQTPLYIVEWATDDICGVWETRAALDIVGQEVDDKNYKVYPAGHYGVFAGKVFRSEVIPDLLRFQDSHSI